MLTYAIATVTAFAAALSSTAVADPLTDAQARFDTITAYRVTLRSTEGSTHQEIRYVYRKPGWVRMEFIRPYPGAVLVYNPLTREVTLWPFGAGRFPSLPLSPDNRLLRSARGHRIDRTHVGILLSKARALAARGSLMVIGVESVGGRTTRHVAAIGPSSDAPKRVHRFDIWLTLDTQFPLKVETTDILGTKLERVLMDDAEIDPVLPATLFETRSTGDASPTTRETAP